MTVSQAVSILEFERNNLLLMIKFARSKEQVRSLFEHYSVTVHSLADALSLPNPKGSK